MCSQLVEIQQMNEPKVTKMTPCQNSKDNVVCKIIIENTVENIGLKYESVTNIVILPLIIPIFQAA